MATVNRRLAAVRTFYCFLETESRDAPANPVLARRHLIRQGRRLPRDAKDADIERLLASITSSRDRAIFLLMLRCGLRVGEVRHLSLDDLCLSPPRLRVCGKGDAQRVAYLSPQVVATLQAWLAVRPDVEARALCLNRSGRRLPVGGIQNRLAGYCRAAGVRITCHQLRHTFARHLVEAGVPVTSIQRLLGHRRLRTTELYLHLSDRQVQADYDAAIARVARCLSPKGGADG